MKMLAPTVAMLWENWRLTRIEAAVRLTQNLLTITIAVLVFRAGASVVFWFAIAGTAFIWFSIAKLNGGRFMDGYKPGFPLYLLYTRPVPTWLIVGVSMAYDALSHVVLYILTAVLVKLALGVSLPMFSMAVFLITCHFAYFCVQYSTRSRVVQWVGSLVFIPLLLMLIGRVAMPLEVEFTLAENVLMALACAAAYAITVAGVARQRRGETVALVNMPAASGYPDWLVNLFRLPCPTSSATRAQIWFELKSSGVPVITLGVAMGLAIFLLYAASIAIEPIRPAAVAAPIMFGLPVLIFFLGGNAFGIRRKQGRTYLSAFEATQPYGTAQLASIKVLVRTACLLVAMIVVFSSLWVSSALLEAWDSWIPDGSNKDAKPGLLKARQELGHDIGSLLAMAPGALAVTAFVALALMVAWFAAFKALRTRYPRRVLMTGGLMLLFAIAVVLLLFASDHGVVSQPLAFGILGKVPILAAIAAAAWTIYLFWSGFARRAITMPYLFGALLVAAAFIAALLRLAPAAADTMLWPALLVPMICALAPWSLDRLRHA